MIEKESFFFLSKAKERQGPHKPFTRDKENTKSALHACIKIHIHHHHHHRLTLSLSLSEFWILHQNPIFNIYSLLLVPLLISHHVLCFPSFLKYTTLSSFLCYILVLLATCFSTWFKFQLQSYFFYSLRLRSLIVKVGWLVAESLIFFALKMIFNVCGRIALILCILQIVILLPFSMFIPSLWICSKFLFSSLCFYSLSMAVIRF